jgi:hypothetical protein
MLSLQAGLASAMAFFAGIDLEIAASLGPGYGPHGTPLLDSGPSAGDAWYPSLPVVSYGADAVCDPGAAPYVDATALYGASGPWVWPGCWPADGSSSRFSGGFVYYGGSQRCQPRYWRNYGAPYPGARCPSFCSCHSSGIAPAIVKRARPGACGTGIGAIRAYSSAIAQLRDSLCAPSAVGAGFGVQRDRDRRSARSHGATRREDRPAARGDAVAREGRSAWVRGAPAATPSRPRSTDADRRASGQTVRSSPDARSAPSRAADLSRTGRSTGPRNPTVRSAAPLRSAPAARQSKVPAVRQSTAPAVRQPVTPAARQPSKAGAAPRGASGRRG